MQWLGKGAVVAFGHHSALAIASRHHRPAWQRKRRAGETGPPTSHILPRPAVRRAIFLTTAASPIELATWLCACARYAPTTGSGWMACPIRRGRQRQSGSSALTAIDQCSRAIFDHQ